MDSHLEFWAEWKRKCALDLCSDGTRGFLRAFAKSRFNKLLRRFTSQLNGRTCEDPWHLFETHVTTRNTRQGKRYKDWLFARVENSEDDPIDVIQGGASLIMRDVVRYYARKEYSPHSTISLNKPLVDGGASATTLFDLLPANLDPVSEIALHEYEALAKRHALRILENISDRERVVLVARQMGLSFAHNAVETTAGCKKSVLSATYQEILTRIASDLRTTYAEDGQEALLTLSLMTVHEVSKRVLSAARSKRRFVRLWKSTARKKS